MMKEEVKLYSLVQVYISLTYHLQIHFPNLKEYNEKSEWAFKMLSFESGFFSQPNKAKRICFIGRWQEL